jgi:DNA modification methylase
MKTDPDCEVVQKIEDIRTEHRILFTDSRDLRFIQNNSVDLVVTSPPYPLIEMWDSTFLALNPLIADALEANDGPSAFELMHRELDKVWKHCYRILKPGSIACINIGDAVRTIGGDFRIYSNHARVLSAMGTMGFHTLPDILWRKQTNAPNKFMGSGMLPAGAYVTYEHEYILIFRKGSKRQFATEADKARRRASSYFWEERNVWFSDVWNDLKGTNQQLCDQSVRTRSGAYPFELAFRLICMYSLYGDLVFDPFLGTGTTTAAAIAAGRNSLGAEHYHELSAAISESVSKALSLGAARTRARFASHRKFVRDRMETGYKFKHHNSVHHFPVMTSQEVGLSLYVPDGIKSESDTSFEVTYRRPEVSDVIGENQLRLFETPNNKRSARGGRPPSSRVGRSESSMVP